jgi:GNAT superfamily N-acetyltransferase
VWYHGRVTPLETLREELVLDDGTRVIVRGISPDDAAELRRGFERLSPSSRYRRFLGVFNVLTDATLHYLTHVDGVNHVAIGATTQPDGAAEPIGIAVARFVRLVDEPTIAEAAITVADDMQGKGLGRRLAVTLGRLARERGIAHFRGEVLADNAAIRQLLAELGAAMKPVEDGRLSFDIPVDMPDEQFEPIARRLLDAASRDLVGHVALERFLFGPRSPS